MKTTTQSSATLKGIWKWEKLKHSTFHTVTYTIWITLMNFLKRLVKTNQFFKNFVKLFHFSIYNNHEKNFPMQQFFRQITMFWREIDFICMLSIFTNFPPIKSHSHQVYYTQCGKMKNLVSLKKYSVKSSDLFSKTVAFTKFLPKKCETKIP